MLKRRYRHNISESASHGRVSAANFPWEGECFSGLCDVLSSLIGAKMVQSAEFIAGILKTIALGNLPGGSLGERERSIPWASHYDLQVQSHPQSPRDFFHIFVRHFYSEKNLRIRCILCARAITHSA